MVAGEIGKICFARLLEDEDLVEGIRKRAEENEVKAGAFMLIGTLKTVTLGFFRNKKYELIRMQEPLEIVACIGNISTGEKGEVIVHAHIVVSNEKGEAFGGHLMKESKVGATAELVIFEAKDVALLRAFDEKTGLNLLKLS
ncbi:MAG: DUF296 domain-containing protein [Candidatus Bathyarchaeia archaeon]